MSSSPAIRRSQAAAGSINSLLLFIGLSPDLLYCDKNRPRGTFWVRNEPQLLDILRAARSAWRAQIKRLHPDRGGDQARAAELNVAWDRIRRRFARRGISLGEISLPQKPPKLRNERPKSVCVAYKDQIIALLLETKSIAATYRVLSDRLNISYGGFLAYLDRHGLSDLTK